MKLEEAIRQLDKSASLHVGKESGRIRQKFSNILQEVKYKELSGEQMFMVEKELEKIFGDIDLEDKNVDPELKARLKIFLNSLRLNYSLVPEGYCASYGVKLGLVAGLFVMLILLFYTDSTLKFFAPLGGMLLGFMVGSYHDRRQKSKGKSLLTRMV